MSPSPETPSTLAGTSWRAISVAGDAPVEGSNPTLAFTEDEISGTTGCNQFFGGYTYDAGTISMSNVGMTMMACDGPISEVEAPTRRPSTARRRFRSTRVGSSC